MSLRGRGSRDPIVFNNTGLNGNLDSPVRINSPYPEREIYFENATATTENSSLIAVAISGATNGPLLVSNHPQMAFGTIVPILLGTPQNPNGEFLYTNPYINDQNKSLFYPEYTKDCEKTYLFANIVANRGSNGFKTPVIPNEVPYSPNKKVYPLDNKNTHQVMFVKQSDLDNKYITIDGLNLNMYNAGRGVPVMSENTLEIDTWYNGKFNKYNIGNNVGIGYTNAGNEIGERYTWSFGTIWFTYNLSTSIDKNIDGTSKTCIQETIDGELYNTDAYISDDIKKGKEIKAEYSEEIKLIAWKFAMDSVRGPSDIYTPDNVYAWESEIIEVGDEKWKMHLPELVVSENTSGDAFIGTSGPLYNEYFNGTSLYTDNQLFKDIGWYEKTKTSWYGKVYGKALYTHAIRSIVTDGCIAAGINTDGNIVFSYSDACCICCYKQ